MISALDKKLLRDLGKMRGQILTISLVMACGVAGFVTLRGTLTSLEETRDAYYERNRFAHVFAEVKRAPDAVAWRIQEIAGVTQVETRVVESVMLPMPGMREPAVGQLLSLPRVGPPILNVPHLRSGRFPTPNERDVVVVNEAFALAHDLTLGDTVPAVMNGRLRDLRIVGTAMSPEYVFAALPGDIATDARFFAVLWTPYASAAAAFQFEGAFNNVTVRLAPDTNASAVISALDRILAPFGSQGAYDRGKQLSHVILKGELDQLKVSATWVPLIFLAVAAFLLNLVLSRTVRIQRQQIACLKALGYGNGALAAHYLKLTAVIALLGAAVGTGLGAWLGRGMTGLYTDLFRFPFLVYEVDPGLLALAVTITTAACLVGALAAVRSVASLPPAVAMQSQAPERYSRAGVFGRVLAKIWGPTGLMVAREVFRRPLRTCLSALGVGAAVGILIVGRFGYDSFSYVINDLLDRQRQEDLVADFPRALPVRTARSIAHVPGVAAAEPVRAALVRVHAGHRHRDVVAFAGAHPSRMRQLIDLRGKVFDLPSEGVVITRTLAELLNVRTGDLLRVELREGERQTISLPVASLLDEPFGLQLYLRAEELEKALGQEPSATSVLIQVEHGRQAEVIQHLKDIPAVLRVTRKESLKEQFDAQTGEWMAVMTLIMTIFALVIAVGVVYNNARVALSMRSRDLGSLRVLGFTRREVSTVLLGELSVQCVLAIPIGIWLGRLWAQGILNTIDPEAYRFPVVVSTTTYVFAISAVLAASIVSALLVRRKIDKLDLVAVLKTRD